MASYLRPRRGKRSVAENQGIVLKRGEVFFECPDTGVGTGAGKIKVGDGTTAYVNLPYFTESTNVPAATIDFTDSSSATPATNNPTYLTNIKPSNSLRTIFTNLKQLLYNFNSEITQLNNDLNLSEDFIDNDRISFGINNEGEYGYRKLGEATINTFGGDVKDEVSAIEDDLKVIGDNRIRFGVDSDGNYGYKKVGEEKVNPFGGDTAKNVLVNNSGDTISFGITPDGEYGYKKIGEDTVIPFYFNTRVDPTKVRFTEDEFIQIINQGDQSKMMIGAKIYLFNTYCDTYEVIDVNHDGTSNTVDIMAITQVGNMAFGSTQLYDASPIRTWLNGTYLQAFSTNIQNLAKTMNVAWNNTTLQDKVKLLSGTELGFSNQYLVKEGNRYPIFNSTTSADIKRWRPVGTYGNSERYWTRSRYTNYSNFVCFVRSNGHVDSTDYCTNTYGVLPALRF